jgi:hypothetical protein
MGAVNFQAFLAKASMHTTCGSSCFCPQCGCLSWRFPIDILSIRYLFIVTQKAKQLNAMRALRRIGSKGMRRSARKLGMSMSSLSVFRKV